MVWSRWADSQTTTVQSFMRFQENVFFAHQHPPWYVHLLYADMIASAIIEEFKGCHDPSTNRTRSPVETEKFASAAPIDIVDTAEGRSPWLLMSAEWYNVNSLLGLTCFIYLF
jgi:hypothetical protein